MIDVEFDVWFSVIFGVEYFMGLCFSILFFKLLLNFVLLLKLLCRDSWDFRLLKFYGGYGYSKVCWFVFVSWGLLVLVIFLSLGFLIFGFLLVIFCIFNLLKLLFLFNLIIDVLIGFCKFGRGFWFDGFERLIC